MASETRFRYVYVLTDPAKALAFERYLKSDSGHAFAQRRLL